MSITYEIAAENDREEVLALIDRVFSGATGKTFHFEQLLPKAYAPDIRGVMPHHYITRCDGKIIGAIGCYQTELCFGSNRLRVGYVGSVSVAPEHRGEGHMIAMMKLLREEEQKYGCDFLFLGGQRQRYEHYGFTQAGIVMRYRIIRSNRKSELLHAEDLAHISFRRVERDDDATLEALEEISHGEPVTAIRRSFYETMHSYDAVLYEIRCDSEMVGYYNGRPDGEIVEYALKDYALTPAFLNALLDEMPQLSVICAVNDTNKNFWLSRIAEATEVQKLGMIDVLNWQTTLKVLLEQQKLNRHLQDGTLTLQDTERGQTVTVSVVNGEPCVRVPQQDEYAETVTHQEFQKRWFDLNALVLPGELPDGWAPLPLYISEADMF